MNVDKLKKVVLELDSIELYYTSQAQIEYINEPKRS